MKTILEVPMLRFLLGFASLMLLGTAAGHAGMAGIQDNAGFFSERAKAEASRSISEMERTMKKDLAIETFKTIPDDMKQGVNLQDKAAVNRLFEQWALKQAKQKSVNGVYILIVREPSHLQAVVGNETQKRAFTLQDRDALVNTMLAKLRKKEADAALLDGVSFVLSTMRSHAVTRSQPAPVHVNERTPVESTSSTGWILPAVIGALVVWIVIAIVRSLLGGGAPAGSPMMAGNSGGGFFRSLLGSMFGAAAGMWMYDQFFGHHSSAAEIPHQDSRMDGDSGFSVQDTDYSGSGGSFDDSSSGGDSGGGFGGDSGGDFGGGGSGGGDF